MLQSIKNNWHLLSKEDKQAIVHMVEALHIKNNKLEEVRRMEQENNKKRQDEIILEGIKNIFFPSIIKDERLKKIIIAIYSGTLNDGTESAMNLSDTSHTGIQKDKLWPLVRKELDMSPLQMKHKIIFFKASKLLIETNFSIEKISVLCGYTYPSKFTLRFEKSSGHTPMNYRKKFGL